MSTHFDFSNCPLVRRLAEAEPIPVPAQKPPGWVWSSKSSSSDGEKVEIVESGQLEASTSKAPSSSFTTAGGSSLQLLNFNCPRQEDLRLNANANTTTAPTRSSGNGDDKQSKLLEGVNQELGEEILTNILPTADTQMSSVEGNEMAKQALEESVVLPSLNPQLFTGLRAPCKGILLFGPPGNGKTMLAKAVASECHSTFFNVSAATIMSKWVGDGERMVQALFKVARNAQPSIIFIDEVDSMLCQRSENENAAARRVKTEFLVQLDGCSGKSEDRILVLAATNRPQELDEGILRRFPKRVFIDLPDRTARANMIQRTFEGTNTPAALGEDGLDILADRTEKYSYSDLDALCRAAAMIPVRAISRSIVTTTTASELRPVNMEDFEVALRMVKPSHNDESRQKLLEFASRYAQGQ